MENRKSSPGAVLALVGTLIGTVTQAQVTERVSVTNSGVQGDAASFSPSISANGRWVAFESFAANLVVGDTNAAQDVFVRDRLTGTVERVNVATGGVQANSFSAMCSISADGRYVAFMSNASNLVAGDTNAAQEIFVHDRQTGATERASVADDGSQAAGQSQYPSISADGRYVAFRSDAANLVAGDTNGHWDIYVRDRVGASTVRASVHTNGAQANWSSYRCAISADGRYVAFHSGASNLVTGDANLAEDVFVRDLLSGTTELASIATGGAQGNGGCERLALSADGRHVVFDSHASNLVAGDTNGMQDIFLRDRAAGTTERVSVGAGGAQGNGASLMPSISADGRYVSFSSTATSFVAADTNGTWDVYVRDRAAGTTERVSVATGGTQANGLGELPSISADGRFVAFDSVASNLVAGDTGLFFDVFVRDRGASGFVTLCEPGANGVVACPCSNPPAGAGRGCDNSSATGGASLTASGVASLALDTLILSTAGERPTSTSILVQGNAVNATGLVLGQGVSCIAGSILRLYTKTASSGSVVVPDFGAGDPALSLRSAAKGDPIQPGQSRWYAVYYRDTGVLGGCPPTSTFNVTSAGRVTWSP